MVIDIILVIVAVYGFYVGYSRGIIKTIFSVLAIAVGIIAALRFSPSVTDFLKQMFNETSPLMFVAGLILTFALTMMFLKLLGRGFEGILEAANINVINQTLGGAFMASVLILIYSGILWFVLNSSFRNISEVTADSQTYPFLKEYPEQVWKVAGKMKPLIQDFWDYTIDIMDEVQTMTEKSEGDTQVYDIPEEEFDARRN
ncbi:MAG: hypothetical protein KIPDCIKN_03973 [Haliscomenobacter sp.]|jgi:uncharacterized membrane protein required for colicin V production|nr:hypothetical protein [Haliscomenobacter sp.]